MDKYDILVNIIDTIMGEAPPRYKRYYPDPKNTEKVDHVNSA